MRVSGMVNGRLTRLVVDTGSERTFIREDMVDAPDAPEARQLLCGVTGTCTTMKGPVLVDVSVGGVVERLPAFIAALEDPCLLGLDYLMRVGACADLRAGKLRVRSQEVPLILGGDAEGMKSHEPERVTGEVADESWCRRARNSGCPTSTPGSTTPVTTTTAPCREPHSGAARRAAEGTLPPYLEDLAQRSTTHLSQEQTKKVRQTLAQYTDVFSRGDMDLGRTSLVKHSIFTGDRPPIKQPPRRVSVAKREEMQRAVQEMAAAGLIERSDSPWCSPVVLVAKKDGTKRFCVDYRALNTATVTDAYPLPRIDDTLDALAGVQWFSTLDLKSGYHQVEVAEEDREKTAFSFGQGLWQFKVMPFGLCNAPSCFERLMERVLEGLQWKAALVYLDDVLVFGSTFEEELDRLKEVLHRLRAANLKLSPKKCTFFQHEVPFLGHVVGRDGVRTDPQKVTAVADWPVPNDLAGLRSFLGLCSYYRRFVPGFATVAAPLHQLTRKGARFQWGEACQRAFETLKQALVEAPVLPYPDPSLPYLLDTDASAEGVGAVLSQVKEGKEWVVAYFSTKFSKPEKNYCVTRKELAAVVKSLSHFHHYLYGARFTVRTDHAALRWLKTLKEPEGQLARWLGKLEQYNYQIVHRAGQVHSNADSLSRRPCEPGCTHCSRREPAVSCQRLQVRGDPEETGEQWGKDQRSDAELGPVIAWLEESSERPSWESISPEGPVTKCLMEQWELLRLEEGVLQRRWVDAKRGEDRWLVVVPRARREELLREMHEGNTSGHSGIKRTLCRLRQRVYWVGLRQDVQEWCRSCKVCAAKKGPARKTRAPLQLYQAGAPLQRMAVDIAGPFTRTHRGNRFICVAMDYFTKWPEACALPNHEAETVADFLVTQVFTRFGVPGELHSDQGREFESRVFKECCRLLGVDKTRTTPLHPQSDGMVERYNATLVGQLARYCEEGQQDWDEWLPYVLMAYRAAEHEATHFTPARLMFGREMRLPVDLALGRPPDAGLPTVQSEYAVALQRRLEDARQRVSGNLKLAGHSMWQRYQQRVREATYSPGEQVWLHNPRRRRGLSPKLQSPWEGPYTVAEALSAVTYRLAPAGGHGKSKVVHVDRLWKYAGDGTFSWGREEEGTPGSPPSAPKGASNVALEGDDQSSQSDEPDDGSDISSDEDLEVDRPARARRPPLWLKDYVQI